MYVYIYDVSISYEKFFKYRMTNKFIRKIYHKSWITLKEIYFNCQILLVPYDRLTCYD